MRPEYPLRAEFDDGEIWTFEDPSDLACNLEWADTTAADDVKVFDRNNRPVRLLVKACEILVCELHDPRN